MATLFEKVLNGPGIYGGINVQIDPYNSVPSNVLPIPVLGDFQSGNGTGPSLITLIRFDKPIDWFEIRAKNSSGPYNRIIAYDGNYQVLAQHTFDYGTIVDLDGRITTVGTPVSLRRFEIRYIRYIELIPAVNEHIFYGDMVIRPQEATTTTLPPDPTLPGASGQVRFPIRMTIVPWPEGAITTIPVRMKILPESPTFDIEPVITPAYIQVVPIPIPLEKAIVDVFRNLINGKFRTYFDDARELKTLLNFGNDSQALLTNWQRDPVEENAILAKLYQPLDVNIEEKTLAWVSREISPPLLDRISVFITPDLQVVFFLRPPHRNIEITGMYGISIDGKSLNDLIPSGSIQISGETLSLDNTVLQQRYRTALEGVELNVDYTDYNNFVHFGSAKNRLKAFREKLILLETATTALVSQTAAASQSLSAGGISHISGTAQYASMQSLVNTRNDIIRGLDGYERFLYYESGSFSGSISGQKEDPIVFVSDVSWPKTAGAVLPVDNATSITFYTEQSDIAGEFDQGNQEYLVNNIPSYLLDDQESDEYITFLNLVGHHFDVVKLYVDDMTDIYDRDPSPDRGMAKDLIWNVGHSLGIKLPNQYAIKELIDYYTTEASSSTAINYQTAAQETWKRFIHNQIFISKAKGTVAGLQGLINSYGIRPEIIRIQEGLLPFSLDPNIIETFDEATNVVALTGQQALTIPFGGTGLFSPYTIELRWGIQPIEASFTSSVLLHGVTPNDWFVVVVPTGSLVNHRGVVQLLDPTGSVTVQSTVSDFYSGDYYSLMLRQNDAAIDFYIKKYDDGEFEYSFTGSVTSALTASLSQSTNIVLGSDGTIATGSANIRLDEFRLWTEVITDATFDSHVKFPGLYAGNTSGSALTNLLVRHSFNQAQDLSATSSLVNESPNPNATGSLSASVASGFAVSASYPYSMEASRRQTERFVANAGTQYGSNTVTIAPSPTFDATSIIVTGSVEIPVLSRTHTARQKLPGEETAAQSQIGFYLSLSETINDSIFRSLGNFDLNEYIGDPADVYSTEYVQLTKLNKFYVDNFAATYSYTKFIQFTEDLLEGIFRQAEDFNPASGKILTGITIEPTVLERSKVRLVRPLTVDGAGTRIESSSRQLLTQSGSLPGTRNVTATINRTGSFSPSADMKQIELEISEIGGPEVVTAAITNLSTRITETSQSVSADSTAINSLVDITDEFTVQSVYSTYDILVPPTSDPVVTSLYPTYDSRIAADPLVDPLAVSLTYETLIDKDPLVDPLASYLAYETLIDTDQLLTSMATELAHETIILLVNDDTIDMFYTPLSTTISSAQNTGSIIAETIPMDAVFDLNIILTNAVSTASESFFLPVVGPTAEFSDPRSRTYFTNPSGSYGVLGYIKVRVGDNRLTDRGDWVKGETYAINDVVFQRGQSGSAAIGDDKEFTCLTTTVVAPNKTIVNFVSRIPPFLDTKNWRATLYTPKETILIKKAVVSGSAPTNVGDVAIVESDNAGTPFVGYSHLHYRYRKDTSTGFVRCRYTGCKQTIDTTFDGESPVEVTLGSEAQLFVKDGTPVQSDTDEGGPILDVR